MGRRHPNFSFSGQITAVIRQSVVHQLGRASPLEAWTPAINVYELRDRVEVCVDLAGVDRERVQVHVEPGVLRLEGVRHPPEPPEPPDGVKAPMRIVHMEVDDGPFHREIEIPSNVVLDAVRSVYREGMLFITLPLQSPPRSRSRRGS